MRLLQDFLLDDAQMRAFVGQGYLKLHLPMGADFHVQVFADTEAVFAEGQNPGDDVYNRVPLLHEVFSHPMVRGALTSILGDDYFMYPHRHCHLTPPQREAQHDHKDSIPADHFVRQHRCRWAMAFYYPQDTTMAYGPTGVRPGSQYYLSHAAAMQHDEIPMVGSAGDLVIVHYDVWHRGLTNSLNKNRFMNKFLFCRASEPTAPTWKNESESLWPPMSWGFNCDAAPIWNSIWDWHRGMPGGNGQITERATDLEKMLSDEDEHLAMNAAYKLAASGEEGAEALFRFWPEEAVNKLEANLSGRYRNPSEMLSTHGITASGSISVPRLENALGDKNWWIRASAADRLGDVGIPAQDSIPALIHALEDSSEWVRRNAAFSLGVLDNEGFCASELGKHLKETAPRVAQNASLALCKMARHAQVARDDLTLALESSLKYVRANSRLALKIMETGSSQA